MWDNDSVDFVSRSKDIQPSIGSKPVSSTLGMHKRSGKEVVSNGHNLKKRDTDVASISGDPKLSCKAGKCSKNDTLGQTWKLRSSLWARIRNQKFTSGEFTEKVLSKKRFKVKISTMDEDSTVINAKMIWHAKCGKEQIMKEPYNTGNFKTHILQCKGPVKTSKMPGGGMKEICSYFQHQSQSTTSMFQGTHLSPPLPCPGLHSTDYPSIEKYLGCTEAFKGGGFSVTAIVEQLYSKRFAKLLESWKQQVLCMCSVRACQHNQ